MFVKVNSTNYYINPENKTPIQIVDELFLRMNKEFISTQEKNSLLKKVTNQLHHSTKK